MTEILQRCNFLYTNLMDCVDKDTNPIKESSCYKCTKNNYQHLNNDNYDCLKKLCVYTMFYGVQYVNEIYSFLHTSNFLNDLINGEREYIKNNSLYGFNHFSQNHMIPIRLNIMSLGCGFGPDDIALNKYRDSHLDWNVYFNYFGQDKEPLWNFITQNNALPITYDLLNGMNFQNVNILFINKLFSTLKKNGLDDSFLQVLRNSLYSLPTNSYVIYNDINHPNEGRDEFDAFLIENNFECIGKYYTDGYTGNYTKLDIRNICLVPDGIAITPRDYDIKTVFFLYQKVQ